MITADGGFRKDKPVPLKPAVDAALAGGAVPSVQAVLVVPVALASFRGLIVRANRRALVLPVSAVERVARVPAGEVRTVGGRETITIQGRAIPLARLADALDLPAEEAPPPPVQLAVVVVAQRDERVAFAVDEVSHDEEVLVKHLAPPLRRVRNVAGATLLASGALVPVLNPGDLVRTARRTRSTARSCAVVCPISSRPICKR